MTIVGALEFPVTRNFLTFPAYLSLTKQSAGFTFTARAGQSPSSLETIGSIAVTMAALVGGLAVTSHDTSQLTKAVLELVVP